MYRRNRSMPVIDHVSCTCVQVEKQRAELQRELDDLSQRLDEAGGATQAQVRTIHSVNSLRNFTIVNCDNRSS
jgi:hypothetical protein